MTDGVAHAVDSSELAFKLASIYAFREAFKRAKPVILEPVMSVEITIPVEFQGTIETTVLSMMCCLLPSGTVMGDLNRRKGMVQDSRQDGDDAIITAKISLNEMFGYSTALRSMTQGEELSCYPLTKIIGMTIPSLCSGKGEYAMEYTEHCRVSQEMQNQLLNELGQKPEK